MPFYRQRILASLLLGLASCAYGTQYDPHLSGATLTIDKSTALANGTDAVQLKVQLSFASGVVSSDYTVTFQASDESGVVFTPPTAATDANGLARSMVTSTKVTNLDISALVTLGGGHVTTNSQYIVFAAGPVSQAVATLKFSAAPQDANAGNTLSPSIMVTAFNSVGDKVFAPISLTLSDPSVDLHGTLNENTTSGVATFADLAINRAGTYQLIATSGSVSAASPNFVISSGPATALEFIDQPPNVTAGLPFIVDIAVVDAFGNSADEQAYITVNDGLLILAAQAGSGTTAFTNLVITQADPAATLVASATSLQSATSAVFVVSPASPNHLVFTQQPTNVVAGNAIVPSVTADIVDVYGNLTTSNASVTLTRGDTSNEVATNANALSGVATFVSYAPTFANSNATLRATSTGLGPANSNAFTVTSGPPSASQSLLAASPNTISANGTQYATLLATIVDAYGNTCSGLSVTFSTSGSHTTLSPNVVTTSSSGQGSSLLRTITGQTINASAVTGSVTLTTPVVANAVLDPALTTFTVTPPQVPANSTAAFTLTLSAQAYDGSALLGQAVTFTALGAGVYVTPRQTFTSPTGAATSSATSALANRDTFIAKAAGYTFSQSATFSGSTSCIPPAGTLMFPSVPVVQLAGTPSSVVLGAYDPKGLSVVVAAGNNNFIHYHNIGHGVFSSAAATVYPTTADVTTMAPISFDKDSYQDIALVSVSSKTLSVRRGLGSSIDTNTWTSTATNIAPGPIAAADFNGDGLNDLAIACGSGYVDVFMNNGGNTLTAAVGYNVNIATPVSALTGDVDGNGSPDVIVLQAGGNVLTVVLNTGTGTFSMSGNYALLHSAIAIAGSDINNDGRMDFALASTAGVDIFTGQSNGLTGLVTYPFTGSSTGIAFADFNGDGNMDIAAGNPNGVVGLIFNAGYPSVHSYSSLAVYTNTQMLLSGDIDADNHADFLIVNAGATVFAPYLGVGDGTIRAATSYPTSAPVSAVAVADFNQDGKLDIVAAMTNSNITMFQGFGDGTYNHVAADVVTTAGSVATSTSVVDYNVDHYNDLGVTLQNTNQVAIILGKGDGTFQSSIKYISTSSPAKVLSTAFGSSDSLIDMAVTNQNANTVSIFSGAGNGNFTLTQTIPTPPGPLGISGGDFNSDGIYDLVITSTTANSFSTLRGAPNGTFSFVGSTGLGVSQPQFVAVADFNGDNKADLAITATNANLVIYTGTGSGTFTPPTVTFTTSASAQKLASVDFNNDTFPDLAVVCTTPQGFGIDLFMNSASSPGTLYPASYQPVGIYPSAFNVADVNGDGLSDLVAGMRSSTPGVVIMLQAGCAQ